MKRIPADKFAVLFWLLIIADITGIYTHVISIHFFAKPLLIPALIAWLCLSNTNAKGKNIILTGLVFSFFGDVFLLFENLNPVFFIAGLASFLVTHICYIIFFLRIKTVAVSLLKKQPLIVPVILCYGTCLIWLLFPHLDELKIPVIVYGLTICTMLICSLHIFLSVSVPSNKYYFGGAALFVLSDSILAINKFYQPFAWAGVLLMLSYCAAQYLIVKGFIRQQKKITI